MKENKREFSSFRDPSGYLFFDESGALCRRINFVYKEHFEAFKETGLFDFLKEKKMVLDFDEVPLEGSDEDCFKIIRPEIVPFISYPYEWCFSQLKDAALLTLTILKESLKRGMVLKDASAYNIQFLEGRPIHIDTLSFEKFQAGEPWIAYRQFCQHFLAPLALMAFSDLRLNQLGRNFIDGIPLDLASSLLPFKTKLHFSILVHIHLHAKAQKKYSDDTVIKRKAISQNSIFALIDSLETAIKGMSARQDDTEWGEYYSHTNYSSEALREKKEIVAEMIEGLQIKSLWDLGANNGLFSRVASDLKIPTLSFDIDLKAVEENYSIVKKKNEKYLLPLFLDLTNPSPGLGWDNCERKSLCSRGPADMVLALALIHHLTISNNTPFSYVAEYFQKLCTYLIIEFVPENDSKVIKLLATRKDRSMAYSGANFELEFSRFFDITQKTPIKASKRTLYLMKKK